MTSSSWRTIIVLTVLIALFIIGLAVTQAKTDRAQLELGCALARNQVEQLTTLDRIADRLGLPPTVQVPPIPEDCR